MGSFMQKSAYCIQKSRTNDAITTVLGCSISAVYLHLKFTYVHPVCWCFLIIIVGVMRLIHVTITVHHLTDDRLNMWQATFYIVSRTTYGFDYFCNASLTCVIGGGQNNVARLSFMAVTTLCSRLLLKMQVNCRGCTALQVIEHRVSHLSIQT